MTLILDGDGHVEIPDSASIRSPSTAYTVAFWYRLAGNQSDTNIVEKTATGNEEAQGAAISYSMAADSSANNRYRCYAANTTTVAGTSRTSNHATSTWFFAVCRWTSGSAISIHIYAANGDLAQSVSSGSASFSIAYTGESLLIGTGQQDNDFEGDIAGLYIHNASLTDEQIDDLLADTVEVITGGAGSPAISPSGGYWPFDYDARDASGNGNHGSAEGTADFSEDPPGDDDEERDVTSHAGAVATTAGRSGTGQRRPVSHSGPAASSAERSGTAVRHARSHSGTAAGAAGRSGSGERDATSHTGPVVSRADVDAEVVDVRDVTSHSGPAASTAERAGSGERHARSHSGAVAARATRTGTGKRDTSSHTGSFVSSAEVSTAARRHAFSHAGTAVSRAVRVGAGSRATVSHTRRAVATVERAGQGTRDTSSHTRPVATRATIFAGAIPEGLIPGRVGPHPSVEVGGVIIGGGLVNGAIV